jgi:transcriptional regulator with XRE-family HTH domain
MTAPSKIATQESSPADEHAHVPDPVDVHVGARLRLRRNLLGLSQGQLGKASSLTFQQIQKYERGTNRMGASRLYQLAQLLDIPVAWFFESLPTGTMRAIAGFSESKQAPLEGAPPAHDEILHRRETADLLRAWYRIADAQQRRKILGLIKSMGEANT